MATWPASEMGVRSGAKRRITTVPLEAIVTSYTSSYATYSSGGSNYAYYTFTNGQSITLLAGCVDLLVVGCGGCGMSDTIGAGGGGGAIIYGRVYVPDGTYTATIGSPAGGNTGVAGGSASINMLSGVTSGGGKAHGTYSEGLGGDPTYPADVGLSGVTGGTGPVGQHYVGVPGTGGYVSGITGTSLGYGGGGGGGGWDAAGGAGVNGGGNGGGEGYGGSVGVRGGGGGGGAWQGRAGAAGGPGVVIVRVKLAS